MKKILKTISMVLVIVFSVSFTSCQILIPLLAVPLAIGAAGGVVLATAEIADDINTDREYKEAARKAAAMGRKATVDELYGRKNQSPFNNHADDRLLRRTSELAGGTPVDVSQYIVHSESFAIYDNEIKFCRFMLEGLRKKYSSHFRNIYEYDITVTFEVNKQQYQMDLTAITSWYPKFWITGNNNHKSNVWHYIAEKKGLNVNDIKKQKVKFNKTRKGKSNFEFHPIYQESAERCYYQFDVEVEFQNKEPSLFSKVKVEDFATFNKVYRSNLYTVAGAAMDIQGAIWKDVDKASKVSEGGTYGNGTPTPIIVNFVRAAKYTQ